ncbi:MAG: hypothetical protein HRK26_02810 [Rickettsiaceae bacterium H1]|nr:hypothetical protein [Rickettsiaceae bacterium H1]
MIEILVSIGINDNDEVRERRLSAVKYFIEEKKIEIIDETILCRMLEFSLENKHDKIIKYLKEKFNAAEEKIGQIQSKIDERKNKLKPQEKYLARNITICIVGALAINTVSMAVAFTATDIAKNNLKLAIPIICGIAVISIILAAAIGYVASLSKLIDEPKVKEQRQKSSGRE